MVDYGHLKINRLRKVYYTVSTCGHHWLVTFDVKSKRWFINGELAAVENIRQEFQVCVVKNKTIEFEDGTRYSAKLFAESLR